MLEKLHLIFIFPEWPQDNRDTECLEGGKVGMRKSWSCALCGKMFNSKVDLERHLVVHTGVKAFSCCVCGKSFGRDCNRKRHERLCHGITQGASSSQTSSQELLSEPHTVYIHD